MANYIFQTDDKREFDYAFRGLDFLLCLWDMDQWLRGKIKYAMDTPEEEIAGYEKAREELHDILTNHNINLDMLE